MRIALLGYGKMGKVIEQIALERGHEISLKIDISNRTEILSLSRENTDVVIEFSSPESAYGNLKYCMEFGIPTVCGTTGWLQHKPEIEKLCIENKSAFFYASNYSIGVNLFFELNKTLARLMNPYKEFKVSSNEIHHTEKKDAPSGTAKTLADKIKLSHSKIFSAREGDVYGIHEIIYENDNEKITIIHESKNRNIFAIGCIKWIEKIITLEKGLYQN